MHKNHRILVCMVAVSVLAAANVLAQSIEGSTHTQNGLKDAPPLVTFVELGSVKCIPCRQMQPVMKAIEEKYGKQVHVVFYDVWQPDQREYAEKYGIRVIPTQVFLGKDGKEFFRHEGFFPEAEIDKLFRKRGLTVRIGG